MSSSSPYPFRARSAFRLGFLAACLVVILGCEIRLVSGPQEVMIGETVTFVLQVRSTSYSPPYYVVADVPAGWRLESSTYEVTIDGQVMTGNAAVVQSQVCHTLLGDLRTGFRRWNVQNPTLSYVTAPEVGEVTLEFFVESQPAGEQKLFFLLAGSECSPPLVVTVNAEPRTDYLTLVDSRFDGQDGFDGLAGPLGVTPSPDGKHLYVAASVDRAIGAFARDPANGRLTFVEAETDGLDGADGIGPPAGVTTSPDGSFLYVARNEPANTGYSDAIAIFPRDPASGELSFDERVLENVDRIVVSPDGLHLYASSDDAAVDLTIYSRDPSTGRLTFVGLQNVQGELLPSPDGFHVYARNGGSVEVYSRDAVTGFLTLLDTVTPSPPLGPAAMSPDGRHLYALSGGTALAVYSRDGVTGLLSAVGAPQELTAEPVTMFPESVAVSPDGGFVLVAGQVALTVFRRDPVSGAVSLARNHFLGDLGAYGIDEAASIAFAPDSRHLYATSFEDDALHLLKAPSLIFVDGFESGTTSAWTSTVP